MRYEPRTVEATKTDRGYDVALPSGAVRTVPAVLFEALYQPVPPAPAPPVASREDTA